MRHPLIAVAVLALIALGTARPAAAAGGAFAVDDVGVDEPGNCKIESWLSQASNSDLALVTTPACVFRVFRPVEIGVQLARTRSDGEWGTSLTPKAKMNILPAEVGKLGIAISGGTTFDLITGQNTAIFINVPFTYTVTEEFKINVNAGWLYDRTNALHYFTYGAGFEWAFRKPFTLLVEVFGQAGQLIEPRSVTDPRFQAGLRITPIEVVDVDVIYGRNITGENAHWITVGLNVRFPPPKN